MRKDQEWIFCRLLLQRQPAVDGRWNDFFYSFDDFFYLFRKILSLFRKFCRWLYFVDLVGAALGSLAVIPLLAWRNATAAVLMCGALAALSVLTLANFPLRIALSAYPAVLFLSWIFAAGREAGR